MLSHLPENILEYCNDHSEKDNDLLLELKEFTYKNEDIPQMLCGSQVGNFLQMLIRSIDARKILEIGMFTGYSALKMAYASSQNTKVHTCEIMDKHIKTAQSFFDRSEVGNKIVVHSGPALDSIEQMEVNSFDLAFIDADKNNYLEYYKRSRLLIKPRGIIVLDNMLWSGEVLDPKDQESRALNKTARFINADDMMHNMLIPIRDGLMVCIKK
tara:strand:+ start:426 stop:1064 length:639 start_codon:yes stop_codon:yes gene_type:complete